MRVYCSLACSLIFLAGCSSSKLTDISRSLRYEGFDTFPTPRTFDGPGYVFRIEKQSKKKFPVTELNVKREPPVGQEAFPSYNQIVRWSATLVASYLGAPETVITTASADASNDVDVQIKLGLGKRYRVYDDAVEEALKSARIRFREDSDYYVVREAIAVPTISVILARKATATAGIRAMFQKIVDTTANVHWEDQSKASLIQDFGQQPHYVFFTVDRVVPSGIGASETSEAVIVSPDIREHVEWKEEVTSE
jgi:hypothetical protein